MSKYKSILLILVSIFVLYNLVLIFNSHEGFTNKLTINEKFPLLVDKPVHEDAFYMMSVAWNLGKGDGFVYNYNLPTTGVQPLTTLVYGALAAISINLHFNKWDFIRIIFLFNILLLLLFDYLIIILIKKITLDKSINYILIAVLILFNNGIYRIFTYGLETGFYIDLFVLTILYSLNYFESGKSFKKLIFFSVLLGLTALTRIDFLVIILFFFITTLILKKITFKEIFWIGLIVLIIISPWFIYVYKVTGSIMPSSGMAEAEFSFVNMASRILSMVIAVIDHFNPWIFTGGLYFVALIAALMLIPVYLFRRKTNKNILPHFNPKFKVIYFVWGLSIIPLLIVYIIFFWSTFFYIRYSALLLVFALPILYLLFTEKLKNNFEFNLFALSIIIIFFAQNYYAFHLGRVSNSHIVTAGIIKNDLPDSLRIGCFQSGVVGYLNENVINLDGKMNIDALKAEQNKSLGKYIDREKINVIIDWKSFIYKYIDDKYLENNWIVEGKLNNRTGKEQSLFLIRKNYQDKIDISKVPLIKVGMN